VRLSVSHLDSYLYWRESEDMGLDELLNRIMGYEQPSPNLLAGKAFHTLLEHASTGELFATEQDGIRFDFAIDAEIALPPIRSAFGERVFQTRSGPVRLVGKVDGIDGLVPHVYKLTEKFDAERYTDSYAWRAYLLMFGAQRFVYDVFAARLDLPARVYINDYHRLEFTAYPDMEADVHEAVSGLAEIVKQYLPETEAA
jgi:hypothetical protein